MRIQNKRITTFYNSNKQMILNTINGVNVLVMLIGKGQMFTSFRWFPKEGELQDLNYQRPITLPTVIYKIFAKTSQVILQPMFRDVINPEQTSFLPLGFILDNIVLTQEVLHWAKASWYFKNQTFQKPMIRCLGIFHAIQKMGISEVFINWVKLLCKDANVAFNLSGSPGKIFNIERGVHQGCPLAPYLFLIMGKVLTHIIKKVCSEGRLKGVSLLGVGGGGTTNHINIRR